MLVLTRKVGESIVCAMGDDLLTFTVLENRRGRLRIGVEAPTAVTVHREEVARRIDGWQDVLDRRPEASATKEKKAG
jgi:carbon storage regulator